MFLICADAIVPDSKILSWNHSVPAALWLMAPFDLLASLLAKHFGWRAIFITLGILATAAMLNALPRWR